MISVIYCTREENPEHKEHIIKSCGVKDVEVIEYINKGESLTMYYNKGLNESINDIVVFVHDDVIFNTNNWGRRLLKHFNESGYGILGVAGTTNLPESGRWWEDNTKMMGQVRHSHEGKSWDSKYCSSFDDKILESIIVDGLFFSVKKDRLSNDFNEDVKGFHFYEIDFCFSNHLSGTKVGVMSNIKVTHKSIGMTNDEWEDNRKQFVERYKENLPHSIKGEIFYNEKPVKLKETPLVGVIIPTKGNIDLLTKCVDSIWEKDDYPFINIYIADTGSSPEEKQQIKDLIVKHSGISDRPRNIKLIEYDYYNFAKINNDVVENHVNDDVELLLFCNNDIELVNNAITQMVSVYLKNKKRVGTIGARLHYEDNTIQHSGVVAFISQDRKIMVSHKGIKSNYNYHTSNTDVFGNTAAFMVVKKDIFNMIGGFNVGYQECFEDVEFNLDCISRNLRNIFVPNAVCYHYESQTRNKDGDKLKREAEDYTKRLIPNIINNEKCYNYFDNVSAKDLKVILNQTKKQLI